MLSDETKAVLGRDKKVYVWRKPEERYRPECVGMLGNSSPHAGVSAMFWGCISINGVCSLLHPEEAVLAKC